MNWHESRLGEIAYSQTQLMCGIFLKKTQPIHFYSQLPAVKDLVENAREQVLLCRHQLCVMKFLNLSCRLFKPIFERAQVTVYLNENVALCVVSLVYLLVIYCNVFCEDL